MRMFYPVIFAIASRFLAEFTLGLADRLRLTVGNLPAGVRQVCF